MTAIRYSSLRGVTVKAPAEFTEFFANSMFYLQSTELQGAAGLGFEPRLTDPLESVVLPSHPLFYRQW
jgi:hypothetical protein